MSALGDVKSNVVAEQLDKLSTTEKDQAVDVKVISGSDAYAEALMKEPPTFNNTTLKLICCLLLGCFCQTMNGFDGSLFNGLLANKTFLDFFHGSASGEWAAINSAMYQIGGVCALPFVGPAVDTWGRKVGMALGAWIIILGAIINGVTVLDASLDQLKAGRFLLGFGVSIIASAGPIYVVETAHPSWRGVVTAYCNTFWFTGSILASGAIRGAIGLKGNISWQLPIWLQLVFPGLIAMFVWFIPESPRWLYAHGKRSQAIDMLTKWHGEGRHDSAWVQLQVAEYEEYLDTNGSDRRWWDYSALFRSAASRYRLACNCIFVIFAQWAGNGALTYFLVAVLQTAGYTSAITQTNINLAYACFQFFFALCGASMVERIGRRPLMLFSMTSCCIVWVGMTIATSQLASSGFDNPAAGQAALAMIFLFGAAFSFGITPLQALYPVEVLSYEMRAKGMAFSGLAVNAGGLLNQFAWPIALQKIGWHTYIVFTIWCGIQALVYYFIMPETRKRTLEELDSIFEAPNPVKASLAKREVVVNRQGTIIASETNPIADAKV